jgi:hypothetical protein
VVIDALARGVMRRGKISVVLTITNGLLFKRVGAPNIGQVGKLQERSNRSKTDKVASCGMITLLA